MPQTLTFVLVHIIFSTKDRRALIREDLRDSLHAYLATVTRDRRCECYRVGGVPDHVHLAIGLHPTVTVAKLVGELKANSSRWMKEHGVQLFSWQRGYGAFSVGASDAGALIQYVEHQPEHHKERDFQEEFRTFLARYRVAYDERHVWD